MDGRFATVSEGGLVRHLFLGTIKVDYLTTQLQENSFPYTMLERQYVLNRNNIKDQGPQINMLSLDYFPVQKKLN